MLAALMCCPVTYRSQIVTNVPLGPIDSPNGWLTRDWVTLGGWRTR